MSRDYHDAELEYRALEEGYDDSWSQEEKEAFYEDLAALNEDYPFISLPVYCSSLRRTNESALSDSQKSLLTATM